MTYKEGLAIAQKYGLENEFNYAYNHSSFDDEECRVFDALSEWDLI